MKTEIKKAMITYLQDIINIKPSINAQNGGECIYCGAALDEGQPHKLTCHYLEADRLLRELTKE